ncbi:CopD family protein [Hoyosella rhizosphaerae]|uniref:CopD family protein n=1 Tax=Hoyosella rhizosphaerae TaxID=1755582 RepID=UPI0016647D55|nr:CopD family protein [Hoyosella rhizosphaerae]MBN4927440.1 CopD family protein [Hoyosella rhizosphaerae]
MTIALLVSGVTVSGVEPTNVAAFARAGMLTALVATVGFSAVGWLLREDSTNRGARLLSASRRQNFHSRQWRYLALSAILGAALALVYAVSSASVITGEPILALTLTEFRIFISQVGLGRALLIVIFGACVVAGMAVASIIRPSMKWAVPAVCISILSLIAVPLSGHGSHESVTSGFVAVHVIAAALWCGLLAALAATARSRIEWAVGLPRFSQVAGWCVLIVALSGVGSAILLSDSLAALVASGYGRVVLAKAFLLVSLVLGGWWWRKHWIEPVSRHKVDSVVTIRRSAIEIAVMVLAIGFAAVLALTVEPTTVTK